MWGVCSGGGGGGGGESVWVGVTGGGRDGWKGG